MGMFDLPGTAAANRAGKAMGGLANSYTNTFNQYYQPSMAALWQQASSKTLSPWQQGQFNDYQAGSMRDTQDASKQLQQNLVSRGMGQSGVASGALTNLWNNYGKHMAGARQQQMNQLDQQRMQALMTMLGQAGNAGQSALGAQQGIYQNAIQQQGQMAGMLGQLGGGIGSMLGLGNGGMGMGMPAGSLQATTGGGTNNISVPGGVGSLIGAANTGTSPAINPLMQQLLNALGQGGTNWMQQR